MSKGGEACRQSQDLADTAHLFVYYKLITEWPITIFIPKHQIIVLRVQPREETSGLGATDKGG